jgi:hypothetical protein
MYVRWSGIVLIAGSLLGMFGTILDTLFYPDHSQTAQQILSSPFALDAALFLAWSLLGALALPGFYLHQAAPTQALLLPSPAMPRSKPT